MKKEEYNFEIEMGSNIKLEEKIRIKKVPGTILKNIYCKCASFRKHQ